VEGAARGHGLLCMLVVAPKLLVEAQSGGQRDVAAETEVLE
jgi:hypothetical protein